MDSERVQARRAARSGLGVALATSAYGVSFGALATASGLDVWQACVLSLVMFTGGSQFAFIGVIGAGGLAAAPAAIASSALLGVRNVAYGIRMSPVIGAGLWRRGATAHFTIDESTAVSLAQQSPRARTVGFWVTGIGIYVGWNLTTLAGALLGDVLGDPKAYGLDAAAAAAFLALLWPRLRRRQAIAVAAAAAVLATMLTPALMPGVPVLAAAVVAVLVGWFNWLGPSTGPRRPFHRLRDRAFDRHRAFDELSDRTHGGGAAVTLWTAVLVASVVCVALKIVGYLIPSRFIEAPRPSRIADLLTVALLAALVAVQTLGVGQGVIVDARVPAVLVAGGLLALRAPFLVVVVAAAAVAALVRLWGWAS